jgi:hypothetical protein
MTLVLMLASSDSAYASFNPVGTVTVVDTSPGANSDITTDFNISSPDVNFDDLIFFTPPEFTFTPSGDIPDGAIAGSLTSTVTLGLISGACNSTLPVEFTMLDATIDPATTVPFLDPEVKGGHAGGDTENDYDDQFDIGPDGLPLGVTRYPDYLTRIFDTQTPIARTYGQTLVLGIPVSVNFLLFEPGTVFEDGDLPTDPRLGYPSVTVLDSIGDPGMIPQPSAITDFCTPLQATNTDYGITRDNPATALDEGGYVRLTNPSEAGTYTFTTWAAGLRDADGDGWENGLDVCPLTPNPEWDPRVRVIAGQAGDRDGDAMPDACDPSPDDVGFITVFIEEDFDQYGNRQDNCPLVANSMGSGVAGETGDNNQADADGDQIGDSCDPHPNNAETEGARPTRCIITDVDIGAGGAPAVNPANLLPCGRNAEPIPSATPSILPPTGAGSALSDGSFFRLLMIVGGLTLVIGAAVLGFAVRRRTI